MKQFECGSLVPGCTWHTRHQLEAEIVRRAVEHLRKAHGETMVRPNLIDQVKTRIEDVREPV